MRTTSPALLCSLVLGLSLADPRPSRAAAPGAQADLVLVSDLGGDLVAQGCSDANPAAGRGLLPLATLARRLAAEAPGAPPLWLGTGLLGGGNVGRYLLSSTTGAEHAARLLHDAGLNLLAPGVPEFAIAREPLLPFLAALQRRGTPSLASNLACAKPGQGLCQHLQPWQERTHGGLRLGLLAVLPQDLAQRVGPGHLHDARVEPLSQLGALARPLRQRVDALVVLADLGGNADAGDAVRLARALDAAGAPADVIHLARQDDPRGGLSELRLTSGTLIVTSPRSGAGVTKVALSWQVSAEHPQGRLHTSAARLSLPGAAPAEVRATLDPTLTTLREQLDATRAAMCRAYGTVIGQAPAQGLDRAALQRTVLDAMRRADLAEVALLNSGALSDRGLPLRTITQEALGLALPFGAQVIVGEVLGKDLDAVLRQHLAPGKSDALLVAGAQLINDGLKINGRALLATARYRVATIDFLQAGGDRLLPAGFIKAPRRVALPLSRLVLAALRDEALGTPPLLLQEEPLWSLGFDTAVDLQSVTVSNPLGAATGKPLYDRPQLTRSDSLALRLDLTARAELDVPRHFLQFTARMQYGRTRTSVTAADDPTARTSTWQETVDLINVLGLYSFRGLSPWHPRLPTPYAALGLESEFNRPGVRRYHHLELSGTLGARVALPAKVMLNAGLGVRAELLADPQRAADLKDESGKPVPPPAYAGESGISLEQAATERNLARTRFLVQTTLELPKRPLSTRLGNALLGEFALNYSYSDPEVLSIHELRAMGKLYVELGRPLYLTLGADLYLYSSRGPLSRRQEAPGLSLDLLAGLKVILDTRHQSFPPRAG